MEQSEKDQETRAVENSNMNKEVAGIEKLSAGKKVLFGLLVIFVFFGLIELMLGLSGVRPILYDEDPYVGFSSNIPLFVEEAGPDGKAIMATARNKLIHFNMQRFARIKPPGTYRIFCLGGSTTQGRPYDDTTSFCGWLRAMLSKADNSHQWDLINAGGSSYASYRVAKLMEELNQYQPNMYIIYSGHNEFLEKRTFEHISATPEALRNLATIVCRSRIGTLGKRLIDRISGQSKRSDKKGDLLPGEVETILEKTVGPETYHRDEEMQKQVLKNYRYNLRRMTDIARAAGAKVMFVTPASKLRDCAPFKSEHRAGLTDTDREHWEVVFGQAKTAYQDREWNKSLTLLDDAATIDDRYAELHYLRGRVLWELERYDEARTAFIRARDEDVCPLRSLSPMWDIVIEVAKEREVPVIDFVTMLEEKAEHGVPGEDLFFDHAHPTIEGNRQLALRLLETMVEEEIVHPVKTWDDAAIAAVKEEVESKLDREAHGAALRNLATLLKWAGKYEEAHKLALRAEEMIPKDADTHFHLGASAAKVGRVDEAMNHYRQALELNPNHPAAHTNLANMLTAQGKFDQAIPHYRYVIQLEPNIALAHYNLGRVLAAQRKFDEAIVCYRQALRLDNKYVKAYSSMGKALAAQGKFDQAVTYHRQALQLKGDYIESLMSMAWILATNPDPKIRNVIEAITLAERAAELTKYENAVVLNILATAYAEAGKFDQAITTAEKALARAVAAKNAQLAAHIEKQLQRYKQAEADQR